MLPCCQWYPKYESKVRWCGTQPLRARTGSEYRSRGTRRLLQMIHDDKKLAGWLQVRDDEKGPVRIRLDKWGSVTGRLVSADGVPMTKLSVGLGSLPSVVPAKDGRFRIDGLATGMTYSLSVTKDTVYLLEIRGKGIENLSIHRGEVRDLGDIVVKPME
jgi:hypothetical protein